MAVKVPRGKWEATLINIRVLKDKVLKLTKRVKDLELRVTKK